jgi:copper resistance protein B
MRNKTLLATLAVALMLPITTQAQEKPHAHSGGIFHAFTLEADTGGSRNGPVSSWDLNGWIGGDTNKLWLKSEGEYVDGAYESAEFWAMYSRNIATFWDFQAGIRHDTRPRSTSYAVLGVAGLAPYFIETEAHLFLSDDGDVSARLRGETDFLFTQQLILQPYMEGNLYAQDVANQEVGAGISDAKAGLQLRYEFTRDFAPYVDVHYGRKFGETSAIAERHHEDKDEAAVSFGLRVMF